MKLKSTKKLIEQLRGLSREVLYKTQNPAARGHRKGFEMHETTTIKCDRSDKGMEVRLERGKRAEKYDEDIIYAVRYERVRPKDWNANYNGRYRPIPERWSFVLVQTGSRAAAEVFYQAALRDITEW